MHNRVHAGRAGAQAFEVLQVAVMDFGADGFQLLGAGFAAGHAAHLVADFDEFPDEFRSDETGCSCDENPHSTSSLLFAGAAGEALRRGSTLLPRKSGDNLRL